MARGSGRRTRGFSVKIKTKGGTIFEVDEKVARIFGKIRTEMTYNGTFQRSSSNQAVTRLHSPSPSHSLSNSTSMASLSSSLNSLALHGQSSGGQHHCHCNHNNIQTNNSRTALSNGHDQQQSKDHDDHVQDTDPRFSRHCTSPVNENYCPDVDNETPPLDTCANKSNSPDEDISPPSNSPNANSCNNKQCPSSNCGTCVCPSSTTTIPSSRTYCPRVSSDLDCNVIVLDKTRGGIFALMLRWAKHHMNDPLIEYMERQEELRNSGEGHAGSSLFKTPTSNIPGRKRASDKSNVSKSSSCAEYNPSSAFKNSYGHSWDKDSRTDPRLDEVPSWDARFFSKLSRPQIYEMLHTCSNLHVPLLTEMLAKTVADQMRGKSVEEVREEFGIVSDYTPEEEAALKEDYERYVERLNDGTIDEDDLDAAFRATSIDNYRSIYGQEDDERLASAARARRCCGKLCSHRSNRGN